MATITIRVPEETKAKIEKYGVNVSEAVRALLDGYLSELESRDTRRSPAGELVPPPLPGMGTPT